MSDSAAAPTPAPHAKHSPSPPSVGSAAFWRKRLARALVVGALALFATWVLPELPTDQHVEIQAPNGYAIQSLSITYFDPEHPEALSGARLTMARPARQAFHQTRLKNGTYRIVVHAEGRQAKGSSGAPENKVAFSTDKVLPLTGERVRIFLDE